MSNTEQHHAELVAALHKSGLIVVEKHESLDCWVYTVAGRSQGSAPTEHLARMYGVRAAMQLITHLIEDQDFYLDEIARVMDEQGSEDDGLEPFKRAFNTDGAL